MKFKNEIRIIVNLLLVTIVLFVSSCVDGFKESETFSSSVRNTTLKSPDSIAFTASATTDTLLTITWPVVDGAGGYQATFYDVDDSIHPVVIGTNKQVIDGCSTTRTIAQDTRYRMIIKTLGNTQYNNKASIDSTQAPYSTLVATTATIPNGTDLAVYFAANPIPSSTTELAYQLVANGSYTMSGDVPTGLTNVTFRGYKDYHATVKMTNGSFLSSGTGLKLKFLDIDCSTYTGTGVIAFNSTFNTSAPTYLSAWPGIMVKTPVVVQSCKITGLATPLIYDNGMKYALSTLLIQDCIIGQNTATKNLISMGGGIVKDLSLHNSTFYNTQIATGGYLIQYANSMNVSKVTGAMWASSSVSITDNTFWQVCTSKKMVNYSGMSQAFNTLTVQKNIFVDTGNQQIILALALNGTMVRSFGYNTYWFNGAFDSAEITGTVPDNSGTSINTDPQLKDPANANFTVGGATQIADRTGDPRWLP